MNKKKTVHDIDVAGKTVLLRVDFNVTFHPNTTDISDDSRIKASLPTIKYLQDKKAKTVICTHLGRPKGKVDESMRLTPVSKRLSELLGKPVAQLKDCTGPEVEKAVKAMKPGDVVILENVRFHPGEEKNDPALAKALAALAQVYVNDAFGAAHRAHSSTEGVAKFIPAVSGLLMDRELQMLGMALEAPRKPFVSIVGGAKVSDKLSVLESLAPKVNVLIIGGGMVATFLKQQGKQIGLSLVEDDKVEEAGRVVELAKKLGVKLMLPVDAMVADAFADKAKAKVVEIDKVEPTWRIMDIGPKTVALYESEIAKAKTVVWNGPMGVFEWEAFAQGTKRVANALAKLKDATTVIGGGSTADAVISLGLQDKMTHVSTGGGASLEFLEGKVLPGVAALMDK